MLRNQHVMAVFGVNPSYAGIDEDDPTIRKVRGFAVRNQISRFIMGNVGSLISTDIKGLRPVSMDEFRHWAWNAHAEQIVREAHLIVFAWGPLAKLPRQLRLAWTTVNHMVLSTGKQPMCWGRAKDGHPRHPLMLPYSTQLEPWSPP